MPPSPTELLRRLPDSFVARFEKREQLRYYDVGELTELITKVAHCATFPIEPDAARTLAGVSRQTPREALRLLGRARREARVAGTTTIDRATVARTLQRLQIDGRGLGGGTVDGAPATSPVERRPPHGRPRPPVADSVDRATHPGGRVAA